MKAAIIKEYGGPEVIHHEDVATPELRPGDVLIRTAATSFHPAEAAVRSGALKGMLPISFPFTLGFDVAGVVERVGSGATQFRAGDRVFAFLDLARGGGGAADYVATSAAETASAPKSCSLGEAASLPGAGLTAWQALFTHGKLQPGQRVLISAAAGGVGSLAVQFAKAHGAYVIGTASPKRFEMLRGIGVDECIDYNVDVATAVKTPVDLVVNLAPPPAPADPLLKVLKRGGTLVSASMPPTPAEVERAGVTAIRMGVQRDAGQLAEIAKLVDQGKVRPIVTERLSIKDAAKAHGMAGSIYGKLILIADEELAATKG